MPFTQGKTNIRNFVRRVLKETYQPLQLEEFGAIRIFETANSSIQELDKWEANERVGELWKVFEACWAFDRENRCTIDEAIERLETFRPELLQFKPISFT
jgi:hypothetical protein